jgi:hypothetical protein
MCTYVCMYKQNSSNTSNKPEAADIARIPMCCICMLYQVCGLCSNIPKMKFKQLTYITTIAQQMSCTAVVSSDVIYYKPHTDNNWERFVKWQSPYERNITEVFF